MTICMTGNKNYGLAEAASKIMDIGLFASRSTGYDFSKKEDRKRFAKETLEYDVFINNSALNDFAQTVLLYDVYTAWGENGHKGRIINIGSTIDTSRKGRSWMYSIEKKALMEASLELGTIGVWSDMGILLNYLSFGSLSTPKVAAKHPERVLMDVGKAASYIKYLIEQPADVNINILHVDPLQHVLS